MLRNERLIQPEAFEGRVSGWIEGDQVIIGFPQGRGFHKASIEQDKHRELLSERWQRCSVFL